MMRKLLRAFGLALVLLPAPACGVDALDIPPAGVVQHTATFVGNVFDGASGARISSYGITLQVADTQSAGAVDGAGRYNVGPISVWDDFTVLITASGHRAFVSHNRQVGVPADLVGSDDISDLATHQTFHFDAYLFPTDLVAPPVTLNVKTPIAGEAPAGKIRLRPSTPSLLADEGVETPAGVPGQVWDNDEDLQANVVNQEFAGGVVSLQEGDLVYGVTYRVDIYDVPGYQPLSGTYQAGVEADKSFTLTEAVHEPLEVVSSTIDVCTAPAAPSETNSAVVLIEFNQSIELGSTGYAGGNAEAIDDGLQISSPDQDGDLSQNSLQADGSSGVQERSTSISVNGNELQLSWNPSVGLAVADADDPILQVTYGGLTNVTIQRAGGPASATALSAVLGINAITCQ